MGQADRRFSPRQRMINLMYIVLTAMLALNVSSDVLDAFDQMDDGLERTGESMSRRNDAVFADIETAAQVNPAKAGGWCDEAVALRGQAADIYHVIDELRMAIAREADGDDGNPDEIENREDLEAASVVMLNPITKRGALLREKIALFRDAAAECVADTVKRAGIMASLATGPFERRNTTVRVSWETLNFDAQPATAAVTLLTKLKNDVRYVEGEALTSLLVAIDSGDARMNRLTAFVVPESRYVVRGSQYKADIVLAAVDSTSRPKVFVNGTEIDGGHFSASASASGTNRYSGYIEVPRMDGSFTRHEFASEYTVVEPSATVSATMMNVMYAGIENPVSISVPGVPNASVGATMTGGVLTRNGDKWSARPSAVGKDVAITVTADVGGGRKVVNTTTFKVRKLPDPTAYIEIGQTRYRGGRPTSKSGLLSSGGLGAAIDDGLIDIHFNVLDFETVFFDRLGNAMPELSDGSKFSARQLSRIRQLSSGKRFYISRIRAKGPDGIERVLSPVEVIVN